MLILLAYSSPEGGQPAARSRNLMHRPDLANASPDELGQALALVKPDALVTRSPVEPAALDAWRAAKPDTPLVVVGEGPGGGAASARGDVVYCSSPSGDGNAALAVAERAWNEAASAATVTRALSHAREAGSPNVDRAVGGRSGGGKTAGGRSVTLVGGGVVNLVTALQLLRDGYDVTLYDAAPDPRDDAPWTAYGCTRGGGDGRMFTLTEADNYNGRSLLPSGESNGLLERSISDYGWLVSEPGSLSERERQWAEDFERLPPWLARSYNDDIFFYNRAASPLWTGLVDSCPGLFDKSTGYQDGILRLYSDTDYFRWHVARNNGVGATRRVLTPAEVGADYPALLDACADGTVAGGIEVVGFTVNIHKFLAHLVELLERGGVRFHWNERVLGIRWVEPGLADGLETAGGVIRSSHYVLSPGAYGGELLRGTASYGQIQGMLGVWLTVPNVEPRLAHSVKIAREGHRAEETNVTLATDERGDPTLIFGAGYGWTGLDPDNVDPAELETVYDALEDTVRQFFPKAYAAAADLDASRRLCVRPWTASCLGVFELVETKGDGVLVVTGGHNTGGFAQSPVVAEAVAAALHGRPHTMHTRYDPQRLSRFYDV